MFKQYADNGGNIIFAQYCLHTSWGIGGGILEAGYLPFSLAGGATVSGTIDIASLPNADHQIFEGITENITYWQNSNYSNPSLNEGGILLAADTNGNNVIAENETGNIIAMVIFPGNLNQHNDQTKNLFANSLLYLADYISINSISPATGSYSISESESLDFSIDAAAPAGSELTYTWKLDGSAVSEEASYAFITDYSSAGNYVVTLDLADNLIEKNSYSYTWNVTVVDVDQDIIVTNLEPAEGPVSINEMESVNFAIEASDPDGNDLVYSWKLDGTEVSTEARYDFTTDYTSAGDYVVTLDVTDNFGVVKDSFLKTWNVTVVDVDQNIIVTNLEPVEGPVSINEMESVNFAIEASDPDGNDLVYSWKLDGAEVSTEATYDFTTDYTSAGDYVVTLDATDNYGVLKNAFTKTWNVTVIDVDQNIIVTNLEPVEGPVSINEMESVNFAIEASDPDGNDLVYSWKLDGAEVSTEATYDFTTDYTSAGDYVVTLDVTDNYGVLKNAFTKTWYVTVIDVDQHIIVNKLPYSGDFENSSNLGVSLEGDMTWKGTGGGHVYCEMYDTDDYITFDTPSHIASFKMNGLPWEGYNSNGGTQLINAYDAEETVVWTATVDLTAPYNNWSNWFTVDVNTSDIVKLEFKSTENSGKFWPSIDNMHIGVDEHSTIAQTINETETLHFSIDATDPDGNDLVYSWQLDGTEVSNLAAYDFVTDYSSAGDHVVTLDVTDSFGSKNALNYTWNVAVVDMDQNIIVTSLLPAEGPVSINEMETVNFSIDATDPDGNELTYSWKLDGTEVSTEAAYDYTPEYDAAGDHVVTLDVTDNFGVVKQLGIAENNGAKITPTSAYYHKANYASVKDCVADQDMVVNSDRKKSVGKAGRNSFTKTWNVTVIDADQHIIVTSLLPAEGPVSINEMETVNFAIEASDPDGKELQYSWKLDGTEVSTTASYDFTTDYTSAGDYVVTLDVTDNFGVEKKQFSNAMKSFSKAAKNAFTKTWNVIVADADQHIIVTSLLPAEGPVSINEMETVNFAIEASDPDGKDLVYSWKLDGVEVSTEATYDFITDYTTAGDYVVTLDVTDNFGVEKKQFSKAVKNIGKATKNAFTKTWNVTVADVDQNIIVTSLLPTEGPVSINEMETVNFAIEASDPDGKDLVYSWKLDGNEVSTEATYDFMTDYTFAGDYVVTLDVTDNFGVEKKQFSKAVKSISKATKNVFTKTWDVTVENVNTAPTITSFLPDAEFVNVGSDPKAFRIVAEDTEGDELMYSWFVNDIEQDSVSFTFTSPFAIGNHIVKAVVSDGILTATNSWNIISSSSIDNYLPEVTKLYQNYPNPFNPETSIKFDMAETGHVQISIFNHKGELVKELINGNKEAGRYSVKWNGSNATSGIYFYKMSTGKYTRIKRAVLVK